MWWNRRIFGLSGYHVVLWFLVYSLMGWIVESVYMSICNRKLTNRGFAKGPFCPIYGVGALTVFFLLRPYSDQPFQLFLLGMILATAIEFITAVIMNRIFGEIWWDYREKAVELQRDYLFGKFHCLGILYAWAVLLPSEHGVQSGGCTSCSSGKGWRNHDPGNLFV